MNLVAIVLTLNEAEHLPDCLASLLPLTERVVVLDSGSTDGTLEIATRAGAEVHHRPFDGYANQRNAALDLAGSTEWVLFLDADERLTPGGVEEILAVLTESDGDLAVCWFPRWNLFFGREIRGGGWWPDHQARLLRCERVRYDPTRQVHEVVEFSGSSRYLEHAIVHLNYASWSEFINKQRQYTLRRVRQSDTTTPPRRRAYLAAPAREFWRRFVSLRGYRDGTTGLGLAAILALEELRAVGMLRARARSR